MSNIGNICGLLQALVDISLPTEDVDAILEQGARVSETSVSPVWTAQEVGELGVSLAAVADSSDSHDAGALWDSIREPRETSRAIAAALAAHMVTAKNIDVAASAAVAYFALVRVPGAAQYGVLSESVARAAVQVAGGRLPREFEAEPAEEDEGDDEHDDTEDVEDEKDEDMSTDENAAESQCRVLRALRDWVDPGAQHALPGVLHHLIETMISTVRGKSSAASAAAQRVLSAMCGTAHSVAAKVLQCLADQSARSGIEKCAEALLSCDGVSAALLVVYAQHAVARAAARSRTSTDRQRAARLAVVALGKAEEQGLSTAIEDGASFLSRISRAPTSGTRAAAIETALALAACQQATSNVRSALWSLCASRCADRAPLVRMRALSALGDLVRGRNSQELWMGGQDCRAAALALSLARIDDARANVRRAAGLLAEAVYARLDVPSAEENPNIAESERLIDVLAQRAAADTASGVRAACTGALSAALASNVCAPRAWCAGVLRAAAEGHESVAGTAACRAVVSVLFDPLAASALAGTKDGGTSVGADLPGSVVICWRVLDAAAADGALASALTRAARSVGSRYTRWEKVLAAAADAATHRPRAAALVAAAVAAGGGTAVLQRGGEAAARALWSALERGGGDAAHERRVLAAIEQCAPALPAATRASWASSCIRSAGNATSSNGGATAARIATAAALDEAVAREEGMALLQRALPALRVRSGATSVDGGAEPASDALVHAVGEVLRCAVPPSRAPPGIVAAIESAAFGGARGTSDAAAVVAAARAAMADAAAAARVAPALARELREGAAVAARVNAAVALADLASSAHGALAEPYIALLGEVVTSDEAPGVRRAALLCAAGAAGAGAARWKPEIVAQIVRAAADEHAAVRGAALAVVRERLATVRPRLVAAGVIATCRDPRTGTNARKDERDAARAACAACLSPAERLALLARLSETALVPVAEQGADLLTAPDSVEAAAAAAALALVTSGALEPAQSGRAKAGTAAGDDEEYVAAMESQQGTDAAAAAGRAAAEERVLRAVAVRSACEALVPVIVAVRNAAEAARSPLTGACLTALAALLERHGAAVEGALAAHPRLAAEVRRHAASHSSAGAAPNGLASPHTTAKRDAAAATLLATPRSAPRLRKRARTPGSNAPPGSPAHAPSPRSRQDENPATLPRSPRSPPLARALWNVASPPAVRTRAVSSQ